MFFGKISKKNAQSGKVNKEFIFILSFGGYSVPLSYERLKNMRNNVRKERFGLRTGKETEQVPPICQRDC